MEGIAVPRQHAFGVPALTQLRARELSLKGYFTKTYRYISGFCSAPFMRST